MLGLEGLLFGLTGAQPLLWTGLFLVVALLVGYGRRSRALQPYGEIVIEEPFAGVESRISRELVAVRQAQVRCLGEGTWAVSTPGSSLLLTIIAAVFFLPIALVMMAVWRTDKELVITAFERDGRTLVRVSGDVEATVWASVRHLLGNATHSEIGQATVRQGASLQS